MVVLPKRIKDGIHNVASALDRAKEVEGELSQAQRCVGVARERVESELAVLNELIAGAPEIFAGLPERFHFVLCGRTFCYRSHAAACQDNKQRIEVVGDGRVIADFFPV